MRPRLFHIDVDLPVDAGQRQVVFDVDEAGGFLVLGAYQSRGFQKRVPVVVEQGALDCGVEFEHWLAGPKPVKLPDPFCAERRHGLPQTEFQGEVR